MISYISYLFLFAQRNYFEKIYARKIICQKKIKFETTNFFFEKKIVFERKKYVRKKIIIFLNVFIIFGIFFFSNSFSNFSDFSGYRLSVLPE